MKWKERKRKKNRGKKSFGVHRVYNVDKKKYTAYKHTKLFRISASKFLFEIENNCLARKSEQEKEQEMWKKREQQ